MHERLFAVVCNAGYFQGLQALLNSIYAYHGREIPIHVYGKDFNTEQLSWVAAHPGPVRTWSFSDLPMPVLGVWEAKQQVFAHAIGMGRYVYLLDADLILTSRLDDVFNEAGGGKIISSADGRGKTYGEAYKVYGPHLPGTRHPYINTGALCLDVERHWDLVGLWAFASKYGAYSPGRGVPLKLPGHGDQGTFNAIAAQLHKTDYIHVLPEGTWCDSTKGCVLRIRARTAKGHLEVWNETDNAVQRLVHSSGPKWWTAGGVRHLQRFGDKLQCFQHFSADGAFSTALAAYVTPPHLQEPRDETCDSLSSELLSASAADLPISHSDKCSDPRDVPGRPTSKHPRQPLFKIGPAANVHASKRRVVRKVRNLIPRKLKA